MNPIDKAIEDAERQFERLFAKNRYETVPEYMDVSVEMVKDFLRSSQKAAAIAALEWAEKQNEIIRKYILLGHTRGAHADDPKDVERCDCQDEQNKGAIDAINHLQSSLRKQIEELKDGVDK